MNKTIHTQLRQCHLRLDLPEDLPDATVGKIIKGVRTELSRLLVDMGLAPKRHGPKGNHPPVPKGGKK